MQLARILMNKRILTSFRSVGPLTDNEVPSENHNESDRVARKTIAEHAFDTLDTLHKVDTSRST